MTDILRQPGPPLKVIMLDPLLHTEANHYLCGIVGCPCSYWPSSLLSREIEVTQKQKAVRLAGEPTHELPRPPQGLSLPDLDAPLSDAERHIIEQTWAKEVPRRRKRIGLWHRIKQWLSFESVTDWLSGFNVGVGIVLGAVVLLVVVLVVVHLVAR